MTFASFKGWDGSKMPGWSHSGPAAIAMVDASEQLYPDHNVISVDHYGSATFKLRADTTLNAAGHDMATFGIYTRSSVPGSISAAIRYESGSIIL